jgi:glutamate formiminotransferase
MPVNFLTPEQARRYGRYNGDPAPAQLAKYFFLDDRDRIEIAAHRGAHNRLGYAVQLCTVCFLGTFLPDPTDVPRMVVKHLATQLEIPDPGCLNQYRERFPTHHVHAQEIRERHGYYNFEDHWQLVRWLYNPGMAEWQMAHCVIGPGTARMIEQGFFYPVSPRCPALSPGPGACHGAVLE